MTDKEFQALIRLSTRVLCRDLGLSAPKIYFSEKDFDKGLIENVSEKYIDNAGYMVSYPPRMFIRRDNCLVHSIEAVAHELVHFKYPDLKHGRIYDEIVATILHARIPRIKKARQRNKDAKVL